MAYQPPIPIYKIKLSHIKALDNYILEFIYEYNYYYNKKYELFIRVFDNDERNVANSWIKTLYLPYTWAGLPNKELLIDEIIKLSNSIEKLKAFI